MRIKPKQLPLLELSSEKLLGIIAKRTGAMVIASREAEILMKKIRSGNMRNHQDILIALDRIVYTLKNGLQDD